jgi:hypothetical protein
LRSSLRQAHHAVRQEQRDAMNSAPRKYSQNSARTTVSQLLAPLTMNAPMMGPTSVARPPTAAQIAISIELAGAHLARVDDADLRHVQRAGHAAHHGRQRPDVSL